jgi:signal transduction histidine kinase
MPVRIKITIFFTFIVFLLLSLLCGIIYYFSYSSRLENIKTHLTNRVLTTAGLLSHSKIFDTTLMHKIDASTIIAIKNKTVQAYNYNNEKIYSYADIPGDTIEASNELLNEVKEKKKIFFTKNNKEAIAYYHNGNNNPLILIAAAFDEEGRKNLQRLKVILWLSFAGSLLIALISGYFFSKILLRPLRKIADEVNIISAQSLTHRIKSGNTKDEWNYLTGTLNDLLNRLQDSFEIQRRFISSASHELSTPLTSISSQLEVSLQRNREAEEYRNVMQSVHQDVRQLSKLTQTLLEFAKASGNAGGIEIELIRIDEVLMHLPGEMIKLNKNYSVKLEFDELPEDEEKLLVYGNPELLTAAIKNIVSNACKYSFNSLAKVKLYVEKSEIIIIVEDEGKGISKTDLPNIFQPFYRTEDSEAITGFGVGLPLVNRIIKLHKGYIEVSSVINKKTTFIIHLPAAGIRNNKFF